MLIRSKPFLCRSGNPRSRVYFPKFRPAFSRGPFGMTNARIESEAHRKKVIDWRQNATRPQTSSASLVKAE